MKLVGKTVESCIDGMVYFTDGTALIASHDGDLVGLTEDGLREYYQANEWANLSKPLPGTDEGVNTFGWGEDRSSKT
jgi:hypothetical protein